MIRTATPDELTAIRGLLEKANDAPYDIGVVAAEKCFGAGFSALPRARVFERDGVMRGVAVTCGDYLRVMAVDREFRRQGIGSTLLEDSGASIIAAEPGNYFTPGVSEPEFFEKRGYMRTASTWNLHVEIGEGSWEAGIEVSRPLSNVRTPAMLEFVERHFGPIWRFEAERASIAHDIEGIGFAVAEANNKGLGTFGPAGVAPEHRGKGQGRRLLLACLADLRALGYRRAIIPWTDALEFYRKSCGAEPAHRFVTLRKPK